MNRSLLLIAAALPFVPGCALFGGLHVDDVATSVQKPSNVALYLSVRNGDHAPGSLFEKNFHVFEDGQELAPEQTKQTLLPRDMAAVHRALLLLDMSGGADSDARHAVADAAARFVSRAHAAEPVTVYAFDGAAAPPFVAEYPQGSDDVGSIAALESYTPQDPSSNLNGAIVEGISQLDARLMSTQRPIRIGSLVVFARGPDLAGRVAESKMREALGDSADLVFTISIKGAPSYRASSIGRSGTFEAESPTSLLTAFDDAGTRVAETVGRYYLLSYCSPARAGERHLRVKVVATDDAGKEVSGSVTTKFDADGFSSGCDPAERPRFVVKAPTEDKAEKTTSKDAGQKPSQSTKPSSAPPSQAAPAEDEGDSVAPPPSKPGYAH